MHHFRLHLGPYHMTYPCDSPPNIPRGVKKAASYFKGCSQKLKYFNLMFKSNLGPKRKKTGRPRELKNNSNGPKSNHPLLWFPIVHSKTYSGENSQTQSRLSILGRTVLFWTSTKINILNFRLFLIVNNPIWLFWFLSNALEYAALKNSEF